MADEWMYLFGVGTYQGRLQAVPALSAQSWWKKLDCKIINFCFAVGVNMYEINIGDRSYINLFHFCILDSELHAIL